MRPSSWFTKIGIWVLVAAFLVLPLYELADYSEVWQHDGDVILPGLFFLFAGIVLLASPHLYKILAFVICRLRIQPGTALPAIIASTSGDTPAFSPPRQIVAFTFSDLRI